MLKKFASVLIALTMLLALCVPTMATGTQTLSTVSPTSIIVPYDSGIPFREWNIPSQGQYDFSGSSNGDTLYTLYYYSGKSSYSIKVNNTNNNNVTVKCYSISGTVLKTQTVSAHGTSTFTLTTSNMFYVGFYAGGADLSVSGYIK